MSERWGQTAQAMDVSLWVAISVMLNRVLFVERSGELRLLARLSAEGTEPKGYQV